MYSLLYMTLVKLEKQLKKHQNKDKAKILQGFFKTKKGEYGEGDIFLGIVVPKQREIAKKFQNLTLDDIQTLLNSKIHEKRLIALLILIEKYKRANQYLKQIIIYFYLKNTKNVNNWDLVDLSAPNILGNYFLDKNREPLYLLAESKILWERRMSIVSTYTFIKNNEFKDTIKIAKILLKDKHDLIHKAVGWMLREVGKKNKKELIKFLNRYSKVMPRTMLRYSIEKLSEKERKSYLKNK
jgi:3-methyladenine DNA glycosylase AlkD